MLTEKFNDNCFDEVISNSPDIIRKMCEEVSMSVQVPREFVFGNILGALFVSLRGRYSVRVNSDYREKLVLYIVNALETGERKSAVTKICKEPFYLWRKIEHAKLEKAEKNGKIYNDLIDDRIKFLKKKAKKVSDSNSFDEISKEIVMLEDSKKVIPTSPILFSDNTTLEKMVERMAQDGGGIAVMESESGFIKNLTRFGVVNFDVLLKSWDGDRICVDKGEDGLLEIEDPFLNICISTQPQVLFDFLEKKEFKDVGLTYRFHRICFRGFSGERALDPPNIKEDTKIAYREIVFNLLDNAGMCQGEVEFGICDEAHKRWVEFSKNIEFDLFHNGHVLLGEDGVLEYVRKIPGLVLRIAGLHHLLSVEKRGCSIQVDSIEFGILCAAFFYQMFIASVHYHEECLLSKLKEDVVKWVVGLGGASFTIDDVCKRFKKNDRINVINVVKECSSRNLFLLYNSERGDKYCFNPNYQSNIDCNILKKITKDGRGCSSMLSPTGRMDASCVGKITELACMLSEYPYISKSEMIAFLGDNRYRQLDGCDPDIPG